ncbi:2-aminomuconic semialdehyde dehydrogenase [Fulvia fulva]|uniref:aldehyde dehydrogenase (NAD(+)) n=1 Tax=Passalora fulva TaxID=5499 RepID=A0A9Q8UVZ6_PASFU|nr:2-aminomuconic semialdehyde dehydrogenase [Fulvia fulva]KAK4610634.1 2-aminomuconic semialdehyde dehydrogenase [Fulvia fulva]KAK4611265.1 2-aminomuconic semialdehyde dehydrogenase [Fulvia fulva]UJO24372.1 2-aminomuconic semialdehyde dehydrogenase [Fulvia fulva]WPV21758.1 2-aminomuconic semialdehyde dehydrogenase [Fulvia fulva]WPV37055.1 2-aminomuconic semialdehyde dehydrogenase [Fulvia fulva]
MDQGSTFDQVKALCAAYAKHLHKNHHAIATVMTAYQSYSVTADEIERSIECLTSIDEIKRHLVTGRTKRVCTFFPLNLPVYSLVLFAVVPSLISDEVFLRPPQKMIPVFRQLLGSLCLAEFFPNIHVSFSDRETFVRELVADADVTIFTGKESNVRLVLQKTRKNSIFLFNGWGCNPIVVAADADIAKAASKAAEAKLFNARQDCAGPDNILVHKSVADQFLAQLQHKVSQAKVGSYSDPDVLVGRIAEDSALVRLASFLLKHQDKIVYGDGIDFANTIVWPTTIVAPLAEQTNYEEFFSPIFYINIFDDDDQLARYFDSPQYKANDMYVSLFGTSAYVKTLTKSIVYHEQTILDVERGNHAYGGYSFGASFVASNGMTDPRPILVPKEISEFIQGQAKAQNPISTTPKKLSAAQQKCIQRDVTDFITQHFGDNLVFGFVFGSLLANKATNASDIDNMIVLKIHNAEQEDAYLMWLRKYHAEMGMTFDSVYPTESSRRHTSMSALL